VKLEDIQPIQILKGQSGKLAVKPCWFEDKLSINVGVMALRSDGKYTYRKGGFNLETSEARELAAALLETADVVDQIAQSDDLLEDGEDD
jgi:hypothetical protein